MATAHDKKKSHLSNAVCLLLLGHVWVVVELPHWHLLMCSLLMQAKDLYRIVLSTRAQSKVPQLIKQHFSNQKSLQGQEVNPSQQLDLSPI